MLGLGASKGSTVGVDGVGPIPVVTTAETLSNVGAETATLEGSYVDSEAASSVGFLFGTDQNNMTSVTGVQDASKNITAVVDTVPGEIHYYQAYAINSNGPGYGAEKQFTADEAPAAVASPFHESYGETPDYSFEFNATNGIYDFESVYGSLGSLSNLSRVSSITDEDGTTRQNVMKIQVAQPGSFGLNYAYSDNTELVSTFTTEENFVYYKSYAVEMYVFIPSSNSHIDEIGEFYYGLGDRSFTPTSTGASAMSTYGASDVGSWKRVLYGTDEDFSTAFGLRTRDGANTASTYFGFGIGDTDTQAPGDIVYVSDIKIYSRDTTVSP